MDVRRLRAGEWITGLGGALLLVALFLPWYDEGAVSPTGWQSFTVIDVVLAAVGLAALLVPVITAQQRAPAVPLAMEALVDLAGLVALVLVLIRVVNLPGDASARAAGLWVGLVATVVIVAGAAVAIRDERPSVRGRHVDLTGVPVAGPPSIEAIPPPGPRP
jgi:hypothetical protein